MDALEELRKQEEESATGARNQFFYRAVGEARNPELAMALLGAICRSGDGGMMQSLAEGLGVERAEVERTAAHLAERGLVYVSRHESKSISLRDLGFISSVARREGVRHPEWDSIFIPREISEDLDNFLVSDLGYGPIHVFDLKELPMEKARTLMKGVEDLVRFYYTKSFQFPLEPLEALRERTKEEIEAIRRVERDFIHRNLGVPANYDSGELTFVYNHDATNVEGYSRSHFDFSGKFPSVDDAFKVGFDSANGYPVSGVKWVPRFFKEEVDTYCPGVEVRKITTDGSETYGFRLEINRWQYAHQIQPLIVQRDVKKTMDTLVERVGKIVEVLD
ncbi:MAG: hypothetical protein KKF56_03905 [Nanoarchaeota archaeon]|nr:hypothetical protein [Nanoarchaeota archaeon]